MYSIIIFWALIKGEKYWQLNLFTWTTLHVTVQHLVMMTFVLQDGMSPLFIASLNGHLEVVKTLIEAGANTNQATKVGTFRYNVTVIRFALTKILLHLDDDFDCYLTCN